MFQEDIENIQSIVYNKLKPFVRRSEKRHIRVQISNRFYLHLRYNFELNGCFKDANHFVEAFSIPTMHEIDNNRASGFKKFQSRVSRVRKRYPNI